MRIARKLMLLAVMAMAAMALMASSASATTAVSVVKQDGTACPAAPTGCLVHQEGEATLFFHFFGIESTEARCHVEYRGRVFTNGTGFVDSQTVTPGSHDADCSDSTASGCTMPWPGATEKDADGVTRAHFDVCINPAENASDCVGEYITDVAESGTTVETQTQSATDLRIGASTFCEITIVVTSEVAAGQGDSTHIRGN